MADVTQVTTDVTTRRTRIGFSVLAAIILTAGICGDAVAKTGKGRLHVRHLAAQNLAAQNLPAEGHGGEPAKSEQVRLGPMRYYGGPKSPMWRGPVEN
ncbi:hypothetical protein [Bradyrhizobium sp.]|uniref:hypothetical protein n=1 Tax=Bradyrhizobium sp. TaxID=376 RepID=UPI003D09F7EE